MTNAIAGFIATARDLARNVAPLGAASLAVKPLWLAFVTVASARVLGPDGYGAFTTAMALAAIAFSFTGWGIQPYTVRVVAADRDTAPVFFSSFTALRIGLGAVATAGALLVAWGLGYEPTLLLAVGAACIFSAASGLAIYSHAFFQAFGVLRYQAWAVVAEKVLVVLLGGAFLFATATAAGTLFGMAIGASLTAAGALGFIARRLLRVRRSDFDAQFIRGALPALAPLGVGAVLGVAFFRVDAVMVEGYLGITEAGYYGLAFRIVEALNLLPILLVDAVVYPRLSALEGSSGRAEARRLTRSTGILLLAVSLPVAALLMATAPFLAGLAGGAELEPAAPALGLLAWAFPLTSIRHLLWLALLSKGEDVFTMWALAGGVLFNIALNAALLPVLGIGGAALATLGSEAVLLTAYALRLRQVTRAASRSPSPPAG